jgi:hypothetical protein
MPDLRTAWGDWLGEYEWTHATTLTFRRPRTVEAARREVHRHLRDLARRVQRKVNWFWVMERTHRGRVHIHTLVDVPLSDAQVERSWQNGLAKVERYEPGRGWRYYITKEIGDAAIAYDISRRLPLP